MGAFAGYEFAVGLAIGKVLVGAALASRLFRSLALVAAAAALVYVYVDKGVAGLLKLGLTLRSDALAHPEFGYGMALGALAVAFVGFAFRKSRSA